MKIRPIRRIFVTSRFKRAWAHLTPEEKSLAELREQIFKHNVFDSRLKTHKLKGKLKNLWSFSITYRHRILFEFLNKEAVLLHDIGSHDIYH